MPAPALAGGLNLGGIASAGLSFVDDIFGGDDNDYAVWSANQTNIGQANEARDFANTLHNENLQFQALWAQRSLEAQERAARNAIQWRVQDAEAAGINPHYALGSQGVSVSPVSVGGGGIGGSPGGMVQPLPGSMGQNLSRSIMKMMTREEKAAAANDMAFQRAQLRGADLDNEIKATQLAILQKDQLGPSSPSTVSDGRMRSDASFQPQPAMPVVSDKVSKSREAGHITDSGLVRTPTGYAVTMSKDMKERAEDSMIEETLWNLRNRVMPIFKGRDSRDGPRDPLPRNESWRFNMWAQEWQPYNNRTGQFREYR